MTDRHTFGMCYRAPARVWSINERLHWSARAELVREWRYCSKIETSLFLRRHKIPHPIGSQVIVEMRLTFTDKRRRDAHNYVGTVCKAVVDGMVDAGLVLDDSTQFLRLAEPRIDVGDYPLVTIRISWEDE